MKHVKVDVRPRVGSNGLIQYNYSGPLEETYVDRVSQQRFWTSLGRKIRKGARIR